MLNKAPEKGGERGGGRHAVARPLVRAACWLVLTAPSGNGGVRGCLCARKKGAQNIVRRKVTRNYTAPATANLFKAVLLLFVKQGILVSYDIPSTGINRAWFSC